MGDGLRHWILLVAFASFVMIVERASAGSGSGADSGTRATADGCTDYGTTSSANAYSYGCSASSVAAVIVTTLHDRGNLNLPGFHGCVVDSRTNGNQLGRRELRHQTGDREQRHG
jgi:hypothetical protein